MSATRGSGRRGSHPDDLLDLPLEPPPEVSDTRSDAARSRNLDLFEPSEDPDPVATTRPAGATRSSSTHDARRDAPPLAVAESSEVALDPPLLDEAVPEAVDELPGSLLLSRLQAGLVDLALHVLTALGLVAAAIAVGVRPQAGLWPGFAGALCAFSFLYYTITLAFWGQTPGMVFSQLRATDQEGQPLHFLQTVLRWLAACLTVACAGLPVVLLVTGRSLADRLSGSEVVVDYDD